MDQSGTQWQTRARQQFDAVLDQIGAEWDRGRAGVEQAAAETARIKITEALNQGLRRLRQSNAPEGAAGLAVELSTPFAERCAMFLFQDGAAVAHAARGLGAVPIRFTPDAGAAFQAAIETRDPVIAMSTESELSPLLASRVGSDGSEKVFLFPLTVRKQVQAILFAAGLVEFAPLELIAGITAIQMESLTAPLTPQRTDLVGIEPAEQPKPIRPAWTELAPGLQALHLRAQREARLRVAEIRLEDGEALRLGRERANIYQTLREPIDAARFRFRSEFIDSNPSMVDYLYLELVRGLAQEDEKALGPEFPGPLA